ncbi:nuclear mitotic apparatus protein 1 [Bombina bombina]|uniref:nuclear mitotic apparatus protein 1 n=1 Tax=Bombina bombina TaxID=8345 RepID=UPI00235B1ACA|nr:nuclear mitotic apparatus protein 1 [Bombina bombina]
MALHNNKMDALLSWVNSLKVDEPIDRLSQLQDLNVLIKIVTKLNGNAEETAQILQEPLDDRIKYLCTFLQRYCRYGSSAENLVQWQKILHGEDLEPELSKIIVLLLYYSNMNSKNPKEAENLDYKTQAELASILRFVLDNEEELCLNDNLTKFLQQKARLPSCDSMSSSEESMSPNMPFRRKTEVRFLELHRVASSSTIKGTATDSPSSPMIEVLHTPQFQMRRLRKQLIEEREYRDELELELSENRKRLSDKEAQILLMQQRVERLIALSEKQTNQPEPQELVELREKNESLMNRLQDTLKQCHDLKTDKNQLERKNDQLSEENGDLSYKVRDLLSRLSQLQSALNEVSEEHDLLLANWQQKQSHLENELNNAITEKKSLEEHRSILESKISILEEQLKKMGEVNVPEQGERMGDVLKVEGMKEQVAELQAKCIELQTQIIQLEQEKSSLKAEMESQNTHLESEKLQLQEMINNLQNSLSEMAILKEKQEQEAKAQEEQLACQITTLRQEISKLETTLTQKDEELKGLHHQVDEERKQKGQLIEDLTKQEESSRQSIEGLNNQVNSLGSLLKESEDKFVEFTKRLENEALHMAQLKQEHGKVMDDKNATLSMFNEYKCTKEEELQSLNQTLKNLEKGLQTSLATSEEMKREKAELALKVQELDATILDLITKCQNLDSENETQSKAHVATVESLKTQINEQENELRLYEQKVSDNDLVNEENVHLKEQLLSMEETVKTLKDLLESERVSYATSVDGGRKKISQLQDEVKSLTESKDKVLAELSEERALGKKLESQLMDLEEEYRVKHEALQLKLSESSAVIKQREVEHEELSKKVDIWKVKYEEVQKGITESSGQMEEEIERLKKDHLETCQHLQAEKIKVSELEAKEKAAASAQQERVSKLEVHLAEAEAVIRKKETEEQKLLLAIQSAEEKLKLTQQEDTVRLSQFEASLKNATEDLSRLSKELSEEKVKKAKLEATVKQLQEQKSKKIVALESELSGTLSVVKQRESDVQNLSKEVEQLKQNLEESGLKYREELLENSNEISQFMEEKKKTAEELTTERAAKKELETRLQKCIDTHKSELSALQNELSRSLDLITSKEKELERLAKETASGDDELQLQKQTVNKLTEEVATLKSIKEQVAMQETELKDHIQMAAAAEGKISELKIAICEKEKEVKHLRNDIHKREAEKSSIQQQYNVTITEVQDLKIKITELEKRCSAQNDEIVIARKEADDARSLASEKESSSEKQQEGIQVLKSEIQQEKQRTSELIKQLEASMTVQAEQRSALDALKKELVHKVEELEQSQKTFNEAKKALSSVTSEGQEMEKMVTEAKENLVKYQTEVEKKSEEIVCLQEVVNRYSTQITATEGTCTELKELLSRESNKREELENKLNGLQAQVESSCKELHEKKDLIASLKGETERYREEADKQRESVEGLRKELSSQIEQREELQQKVQSWQETCAQKEQQMLCLQEQLSSSQSLLAELASLKSSYQELQTGRTLLEEQHKEEMAKHQRTTECWQAEMERAKGEIAELMLLKEKLCQQEMVIQTLQSEKNGYLAQITQLQDTNSKLMGENQTLSEVSDEGEKKLGSELSRLAEQHKNELESLQLEYKKMVNEDKEQLQELGKKLEAVTSKYENAKTKQMDERQKFLDEKQKLLLQVDQLEAARKEHSEQVQELNKQLHQHEKTITSQQQKLKVQDSEALKDLELQQKKVVELEAQLKEKDQAVDHYKSQMEKAKLHYDAKKQKNQELLEELQEHTKEKEQLRRETGDLKQEAERLNKELQHSLLQSKEAEQTCKTLTLQVRSLEAQVEHADRQLRELGKFQVATDALKSRETLCIPRVTRSHADVSIDSLDMSDEDEHPLNSTGKNGRSHHGPTSSTVHAESPESMGSSRLPSKVESLESLYFTPIPTRVQSKLDSTLGSVGDLSLDSSKKTRSARRRTTQVINITMTKKTKDEPETESANTSFYSLRSAPSTQSLYQQNTRRGGRPQAAISAPVLTSFPSQESFGKLEHAYSDDSLNNSVLMNLPGYRPSTRSSTRLSQAGGRRSSIYVSTCQDEPDPQEDWNRIAELQLRNRACPPHLKTSYPLESRPSLSSTSITDEEVKMGDPKETLRRATMLPSQIKESMSSSRRMTLAPSGVEHLKESTTRQLRKRVSEESHHGPDTPESKKSASCFPRPMTPKDKHDGRKFAVAESRTSTSQQQTQASRRVTMAFSILNTPKKLGNNLLKKGLGKKNTTPKNSPRGRGTSSSSSTKSSHLSIRKSPNRRSPRGSTKSPKVSGKFFERKQTKNK